LLEAPGLEAKTLFEALQEAHPDRYEPGQLRTLQRKVRQYRSRSGPGKDVEFTQVHRPGEAMQTDFTYATCLGITLAGEAFPHMLCVSVLPYSNWQWATIAQSESMLALRSGLQRALFQLGRVPEWHQTDNSTAATHTPEASGSQSAAEVGQATQATQTPRRAFNKEYVEVMAHFGMKPRTIAVGKKEQNGDVESSNGALKRALAQALLLRGSTDFESQEAWQCFINAVLQKRNMQRKTRISEELAVMQSLPTARLLEFTEERVRVGRRSTVRVKHCTYSVPSRLIGEWVSVRLFETRTEVWFADALQLSCERLRGQSPSLIDYRHVIWSLARKPGAFARYVYREAFFPSLAFRKAYDVITQSSPGTRGDAEYLRILHLAATTMEADVDAALVLLLDAKSVISLKTVRALIETEILETPALAKLEVNLNAYDALLLEVGT
jgi:hypothetical protein